MVRSADDLDGSALEAFVAVTSVSEVTGRPDRTLDRLLESVVEAAECTSGAFWAPEVHEGSGPTVVVRDGAPGAGDGLARALAHLGPPDVEVDVSTGTSHPYVPALEALGVTRGRVVPMVVGDAATGVCVVGTGPERRPSAHPVRAHAVRVGTRLAGRVIEASRLRDNLERAMAQILLTDERMLGRMGLDIHDGPTQQLSVALLEVQLLEAELSDAEEAGLPSPASLRPALGRIYETVGGALHEMRELIGHLRPAQFEDRRLIDILQDAIAGFERRTDCVVVSEWRGEFPVNGVSITQRITLYRILQETLSNAHRHGGAQVVRVHVTEDESGVTLEVTDDGSGFDADAAQRRRPGMPQARFGLHGMNDRAQILGGSFAIASAPGDGTTVNVFLPRWMGTTDTPPDVP